MKHQKIARLLRDRISQSGLSVSEVARRSDIPQQVLQRFIVSKRDNIRLDTAEKLFDALGLVVLDSSSVKDVFRGSFRSQLSELQDICYIWIVKTAEVKSTPRPIVNAARALHKLCNDLIYLCDRANRRLILSKKPRYKKHSRYQFTDMDFLRDLMKAQDRGEP